MYTNLLKIEPWRRKIKF
jgi:hypothetical protein